MRTAADQRRGQRRFVVSLQGRVNTTIVCDVTFRRARLAFASPVAWPVGDTTLMLTRLPDAHGVLHDLDCQLAVRYAQYLEEEGTWRIGCELVDVDIETRRVLTEYCAARQQADRTSPARLVAEALVRNRCGFVTRARLNACHPGLLRFPTIRSRGG